MNIYYLILSSTIIRKKDFKEGYLEYVNIIIEIDLINKSFFNFKGYSKTSAK